MKQGLCLQTFWPGKKYHGQQREEPHGVLGKRFSQEHLDTKHEEDVERNARLETVTTRQGQ